MTVRAGPSASRNRRLESRERMSNKARGHRAAARPALSPSELLCLRPFCPGGGPDDTGGWFYQQAKDLAVDVVVAAIIALVEGGLVKLRVTRRQAQFGIEQEALYLERPRSRFSHQPVGWLERELFELVTIAPRRIDSLMLIVIGEDRRHPYDHLLGLVRTELFVKGYLDRAQPTQPLDWLTEWLGVRSPRFVATAKTSPRVVAQIAEVLAWRPPSDQTVLWHRLVRAVDEAIFKCAPRQWRYTGH